MTKEGFNVGSVFSGVGGLDLGLHRAGMHHLWFCEQDPYRREVLAHWWPGRPVYEDVREVDLVRLGQGVREAGGSRADADAVEPRRRTPSQSPDLLCGGFPCQDVSVAGKRAGLDGERSGLFHEFARIAESLRPRWLLIENVPGLLSSNGGRDFGVVLGALADLGYGLGWRVVDSRFFGVPQRRRRVFIVGAVADGDPRAAAERAGQVLAVESRCPRHSRQSREARPTVAYALADGTGSRSGSGRDAQDTFVVKDDDHYYVEDHENGTLRANGAGGPPRIDRQPLLVRTYNVVPEGGQGADLRAAETNVSLALSALNGQAHDRVTLVAPTLMFGHSRGGTNSLRPGFTGDGHVVPAGTGVRRLTPTECERLQAWPDGWTNPHDDAGDSKRYAACGDGVTASVAEWIGRRMLQVDAG